MPGTPPPLASAPLDRRIATGLHKLGLVLKHQTRSQAAEQGLSPTQGQILALLAASGAMSASEVSMRLGIGLPTISEAVTTLVEKRLVRRTPDRRHARARLLRLTAAGTRRAERTRAWPEFLTHAVGVLSPTEQDTLLTALLKMIRTLQENGQIPLSGMCLTCVYFKPHVRGGDTPHHCAFVDAPLRSPDLRLECDDHAQASDEQRLHTWARFVHAP